MERQELERVLLAAIEGKQAQTIELLRQLVAFRSVNPPGNEAECNQFIAQKLANLGFKIQCIEAVQGRPNVLATWRGRGGGRDLLFYGGHADVVPAGDLSAWSCDPFGSEVRDGWIYGRGTADHKGSIAASLIALKALVEHRVHLRGTLQYLVPVDEESGGRWGAQYLAEHGMLHGDLGIYGGPGDLRQIIIGSKGLLQLRITVQGIGGHSGTPWLLANPIEQASQIVLELQRLPLTKRSSVFAISFGDGPGAGGTLSVTMIRGGDRINAVPPSCEIAVDRRLVPEESVEEALSQIQSVLDAFNQRTPRLQARISQVECAGDGVSISPTEPIVDILRRSANRIGIAAQPATTFASSDTRFIVNQAHIPIAGYGAGLLRPDGSNCIHGPDECLRLDDLFNMSKIYTLAILEACGVDLSE